MCGLVGAAGNLNHKDADAFTKLLFVSCFRGIDSTGMASRSHGSDETSVIKMTVPSPDFLDSGKVKRAISEGDMLLMGHTRYKTVGEVNKRNAQPFDFENLVGCHNGTLSWGTKGKLEGPGKSLPTDSEALYTSLANRGLDETLRDTHDEDAMALTWFDKETRKLNFYRNKLRPLYYTYSKDLEKVYWASEVGMLYLVLNNVKVEFTKVKMLPEYVHWQIEIPENKGVLPASVTRFCEQAKKENPPPVVYNVPRHREYINGVWRDIPAGDGRRFLAGQSASNRSVIDTTATVVPFNEAAKKAVRAEVIVVEKELQKFKMSRQNHRDLKDGGPFYRSNNGKLYTEEDFKDKMFEGCCVCGCQPAWGEPVKFLRDESVVCAPCVAEAKFQYAHNQMSGTTLTLLSHMS